MPNSGFVDCAFVGVQAFSLRALTIACPLVRKWYAARKSNHRVNRRSLKAELQLMQARPPLAEKIVDCFEMPNSGFVDCAFVGVQAFSLRHGLTSHAPLGSSQ